MKDNIINIINSGNINKFIQIDNWDEFFSEEEHTLAFHNAFMKGVGNAPIKCDMLKHLVIHHPISASIRFVHVLPIRYAMFIASNEQHQDVGRDLLKFLLSEDRGISLTLFYNGLQECMRYYTPEAVHYAISVMCPENLEELIREDESFWEVFYQMPIDAQVQTVLNMNDAQQNEVYYQCPDILARMIDSGMLLHQPMIEETQILI